MGKVLGSIAALVVIVVLVLPFAREAYQRYELARNLDAVMDARDRAAFQEWNGDAQSFGQSLLDRCELTNGHGSAACSRYRIALR